MSDPSRPPRIPTWLLEAVLPPTLGSQQILGDLHEEYVARAARSALRARLWYLREALGIAVRYAGERRRRRHRRRNGRD